MVRDSVDYAFSITCIATIFYDMLCNLAYVNDVSTTVFFTVELDF